MISRHAALLSIAALAGAAVLASLVPAQAPLWPHRPQPARAMPVFVRAEDDAAARLAAAGLDEVGVTILHDAERTCLSPDSGLTGHYRFRL